MKFKTHKVSRLNESVCSSLGVKTDEKINVENTLNTVETNAVNDEIERDEKLHNDFKNQQENVEEFVKDNHMREVKLESTPEMKKLYLNEDLFESVHTKEVNEAIDFGDPTNMGIGACTPLAPDYTKLINDYVKHFNDDPREHDLMVKSLARFAEGLEDAKESVENFNRYWTERYPLMIQYLDSQLELIPEEVFTGKSFPEQLEEATAVAEPKKRVRSANEVKHQGDYSSEDLWLAVYDELSAEVDNEGEGQQVNKQLKARRGERYEKVLPIGDSDIVVYAPTLKDFDFAKKVADFYEVTYDEPKEDTNTSTNEYYKYTMRIHIPANELYSGNDY